MTPLLLFTLMGCDLFNNAKDTVSGLLNPVVGQSMILAIEAPEQQEIQDLLANSEFASGTGITVFLADAANVADIENAPITGADVWVEGSSVDQLLTESSGGLYTHQPGDGEVPYAVDDEWTVYVLPAGGASEDASAMSVYLPPVVDFSGSIPETHTANADISLDFTGLGYDSALVVVLDTSGGITYTNEPQSIKELYDFTRPSELGVVTIPGTAFPGASVYAVGVAGMGAGEPDQFINVNTALSSVIAGKMKFYPVTVAQ